MYLSDFYATIDFDDIQREAWRFEKIYTVKLGVRYSEVNLQGFYRIGSKIVCPLLGGVRYSACPLLRGFTITLVRFTIFPLPK